MWKPKRFYKAVRIGETSDGFTVLLDARPVKTPAGTVLTVPAQALARAITAEWDAQEEEIRPETMPAQQLAVSALDGVGRDRASVIDAILAFAETDLLCYRAATPDDLTQRQQSVWQPLLDWAQQKIGAQFVATQGVIPVDQSPKVAVALRKTVETLDDFEIAVLSSVTAATGSIVIALALMDGQIGGDDAFAAAQLDEDYQNEHWGTDTEAVARRDQLHRDILAAERFLRLHHG